MALLWTTPNDVTSRWIGDDAPTDMALVATLLEDAEDEVIREIDGIVDNVTAETVPLRRVQKVVAGMVIRYLRNPKGLVQIQETAGVFQQGGTIGGSKRTGIYMTDEDKAELTGTPERRAFMVDMVPAYVDGADLDWTTTDEYTELVTAPAPDPWESGMAPVIYP